MVVSLIEVARPQLAAASLSNRGAPVFVDDFGEDVASEVWVAVRRHRTIGTEIECHRSGVEDQPGGGDAATP